MIFQISPLGGISEKFTSNLSAKCMAPKKPNKSVKPFLKLIKKIDEIQSAPDLNQKTRYALAEQRQNLNYLFKIEARGALVRTRFKHINETDSCSTYFFNLEKSNSYSKNISQIRLESGLTSDNPSDIKTHIHHFYKTLYSRVPTDESTLDELFNNLNKLEISDSEDLDRLLSQDELDLAVKQLGKNKTLGLDGLTSEFFLYFWPILKNYFLSVLQSSVENGSLPRSLRRAVITLLPKKGDLTDISNWRPVSLLNTETIKSLPSCLPTGSNNALAASSMKIKVIAFLDARYTTILLSFETSFIFLIPMTPL